MVTDVIEQTTMTSVMVQYSIMRRDIYTVCEKQVIRYDMVLHHRKPKKKVTLEWAHHFGTELGIEMKPDMKPVREKLSRGTVMYVHATTNITRHPVFSVLYKRKKVMLISPKRYILAMERAGYMMVRA